MSNEELNNEILRARVGGLGSSDAEMVATVGRTGELNETAKYRIAQMLGLEPVEDFTNKFCENGKRREEQITRYLQTKYSAIDNTFNHNPYYELAENLYSFKVFNHIDLEVISDADVGDYIVWYEVKTTKNSVFQTIEKYKEQLVWHLWIMSNYYPRKLTKLILAHYLEDYKSDFSEDKITSVVIDEYLTLSDIGFTVESFEKGLAIINNSLKDFAENYKQRVELTASNLPMPLQEQLSIMHSKLVQIKEFEKEVAALKEKLLQVMEKTNTKKISTQYFDITYIAPTIRETFESKLFGLEHPELYAKYKKQSNIKSSIKLKINGE